MMNREKVSFHECSRNFELFGMLFTLQFMPLSRGQLDIISETILVDIVEKPAPYHPYQ